jgi:hypothetical protein
MPANRQAVKSPQAKPIMTDAAIAAKTGKTWKEWFAALDKAGAAALDHKAIAQIARDRLGAGRWYGQMVAVSYERARGLRVAGQKCDGQFSVAATRVMPVPLARLFKVATTADWFPKGAFEETSRTANKYWRGKWKKNARLAIGFTAKGAGKASIAVDCEKLTDSGQVEKERTAWKAALARLETLV